MALQETMLFADAGINAEEDTLEIVAPTDQRTRQGNGRPKIVAAMLFSSTDDIERAWLKPAGYADEYGIPVPYVCKYAATLGFDLSKAVLPVPVEIPENCKLDFWAKSETAANSVGYGWVLLEYPQGGAYLDIVPGPSLTRRPWEHGAALVSQVVAASTPITDLAPDTNYQPCMVRGVGVNGATAGITGPAFVRFDNQEMMGSQMFIPLPNNPAYVAGSAGCGVDFKAAKIKMPVFAGGTNFKTSCIGYTAEQPQAEIAFAVAKKLFP